MSETTVFTARRVRTMERSMPVAEAVAVRDGKVLEVGSLDTMKPWLSRHSHVIDDTFADHVIMPGFIDPHLHPSMAALLLPMEFTTAVDWDLPWEDASAGGAVDNREQFLDPRELVEQGAPLAGLQAFPVGIQACGILTRKAGRQQYANGSVIFVAPTSDHVSIDGLHAAKRNRVWPLRFYHPDGVQIGLARQVSTAPLADEFPAVPDTPNPVKEIAEQDFLVGAAVVTGPTP